MTGKRRSFTTARKTKTTGKKALQQLKKSIFVLFRAYCLLFCTWLQYKKFSYIFMGMQSNVVINKKKITPNSSLLLFGWTKNFCVRSRHRILTFKWIMSLGVPNITCYAIDRMLKCYLKTAMLYDEILNQNSLSCIQK